MQTLEFKKTFIEILSCMVYLSGSIPVAANAAIAFDMISLTTLCRFRDKYRPWAAKHMTNFISK